jgi:hypothetical protein
LQYRDAIKSAIAGLFEARDVLEEAARRMEEAPQLRAGSPPEPRPG